MRYIFTFIISIVLLIIIYENANFLYLNWRYYKLKLPHTSSKCLIFADPQIIGQEDFSSKYTLLNWIAQWDSDRYLKLSMWYAKIVQSPDCVIFLGDLFDQGAKADNEIYHTYVRRFQRIFNIDKPKYFVDGDNDIIENAIESDFNSLAKRFDKHFYNNSTFLQQPNDVIIKKLRILDYKKYKDKEFSMKSWDKFAKDCSLSLNSKQPTVLLSHMTILNQLKSFKCQVLPKYSPNIILSGDTHQSRIYYSKLSLAGKDVFKFSAGSFVKNYESNPGTFFRNTPSVLNFTLRLQPYIYEISVPSTNYRMGYEKTGIGVIAFQKTTINGTVDSVYYNVIWLPYRFRQLLAYICCLLSFTVIYNFGTLLRFFLIRKRRFGRITLKSRWSNKI